MADSEVSPVFSEVIELNKEGDAAFKAAKANGAHSASSREPNLLHKVARSEHKVARNVVAWLVLLAMVALFTMLSHQRALAQTDASMWRERASKRDAALEAAMLTSTRLREAETKQRAAAAAANETAMHLSVKFEGSLARERSMLRKAKEAMAEQLRGYNITNAAQLRKLVAEYTQVIRQERASTQDALRLLRAERLANGERLAGLHREIKKRHDALAAALTAARGELDGVQSDAATMVPSSSAKEREMPSRQVPPGATGAKDSCHQHARDERHDLLSSTRVGQIVARQTLSELQQRAYARLLRSTTGAGNRDAPRKDRVSAVVIGGSVVSGTGCNDERHHLAGAQCAYPDRFANWLRCHHKLGDGDLQMINRARGGMTSASALPGLPDVVRVPTEGGFDRVADWAIIDYSTNDEKYNYYNDGVKNGTASTLTNPDAVTASTEVMLRYLLSEHPQLPILMVESDCMTTVARRAHEKIANYYGVPFVPYADALREKCSYLSWHAQRGHSHPNWHTHTMLAEMLALWWRALGPTLKPSAKASSPLPGGVGEKWLRPHLTTEDARKPFSICRAPITTFDAREAYAAANGQPIPPAAAAAGHRSAVDAIGWKLYEDRPGKPGWISSGPLGSTIKFNLTFGERPRLLVVYESGYEGWGAVKLRIGERASRYGASFVPVNALRTQGEKVTQADMLSLDVGTDTEGGRNNHHIQPHESKTLRLTTAHREPLKFKVIHVSSC